MSGGTRKSAYSPGSGSPCRVNKAAQAAFRSISLPSHSAPMRKAHPNWPATANV
jgi:hypothetical protein